MSHEVILPAVFAAVARHTSSKARSRSGKVATEAASTASEPPGKSVAETKADTISERSPPSPERKFEMDSIKLLELSEFC